MGDVGFKQAMQQKWIVLNKDATGPTVSRKVAEIEDSVQSALADIDRGAVASVPEKIIIALKKRKLLAPETWKTFRLGKGPRFTRERVKEATDLTAEMIGKGTWREAPFKAYNFAALGQAPASGHLHPLLKVVRLLCYERVELLVLVDKQQKRMYYAALIVLIVLDCLSLSLMRPST